MAWGHRSNTAGKSMEISQRWVLNLEKPPIPQFPLPCLSSKRVVRGKTITIPIVVAAVKLLCKSIPRRRRQLPETPRATHLAWPFDSLARLEAGTHPRLCVKNGAHQLLRNYHACVLYIHTYIHYITLHYITLHYIEFRYITLHYITLHYITLHYITYVRTYVRTYIHI